MKGIQIQTPAPSIGLAYLGAFLKENGYEYKAIDACGEAMDQILPYDDKKQIVLQGLTTDEVLERIPPDTRIFGFTCHFSHCWTLVTDIASRIKKDFQNALFVVGGEHPTALPENVLRGGLFDVVVMGEGEHTFLEIVKNMENDTPIDDIEGIARLDKDKNFFMNKPRKRTRDIDTFPYPDWDSWSIEEYIAHNQVSGIKQDRSMPILGSRGCPYACTFCSNEGMWTRQYYMRNGKDLVDEMEFMKKKYDVKGFTFMDSNFIINRNKTLAFCRELIDRDLDITYQLPAGTRCEALDEELVVAMEKSGLKNFALAPESGCKMILDSVAKKLDIDKLLDTIKIIKKTKMTLGSYVVVGFPKDSPVTMKRTISLVRKMAILGVDDITVSKFTPYPGSPLFEELLKKGRFSEGLEELGNIISFFSFEGESYCDGLSVKQINFWMTWMFLNFYIISFLLRPWRVVRNFWLYFSKGVENTRYMRFFNEIFYQRRKWKKC